jgi:hypothetical protein
VEVVCGVKADGVNQSRLRSEEAPVAPGASPGPRG